MLTFFTGEEINKTKKKAYNGKGGRKHFNVMGNMNGEAATMWKEWLFTCVEISGKCLELIE